MKKNSCDRSLFWALLLVLFLPLCSSLVSAAPKDAHPSSCYSCHDKKDKILPDNHKPTEGMTLESCRECHRQGGKSARLAGKLPLVHAHQLSGVTCVKCHGESKKKEAVETEVCESCHDPVKLAQKTARVKPENPHTSPHYGTALNCTYCHHQHEPSENFCTQCHSFDFKVP
jgi:hypothetical protein